MKIRSLLTILALFSVLLLGAGTAHAVLGVNDDVASQDIVVPFICAVDPANGLNTLIAVAEASCSFDPLDVFAPVVNGHRVIYDFRSRLVTDDDWTWTCHETKSWDCKSIVAALSPDQKKQITYPETPHGVSLYAGYLTLSNTTDDNPGFIAWAYIEDLQKGLANGFNGLAIEGGLSNGVSDKFAETEGLNLFPITANSFYARYFLLNDLPDTFNWWIFLNGRNQVDASFPCPAATFSRRLQGVICDWDEICTSLNIPMPDEVKIYNVADKLPASGLGFPRSGFAKLTIAESGNLTIGTPISITGTYNYPICGLVNPHYSAFGWSYQRAQSETMTSMNWDAVHAMHRSYCNAVAPWIMGDFCGLNP